jgi:hypothetical protein
MKITIDLPDELLVTAREMAAENRLTLREIFERGLRREIFMSRSKGRGRRSRPMHWVTVPGACPRTWMLRTARRCTPGSVSCDRDTNLLIYAHRAGYPESRAARRAIRNSIDTKISAAKTLPITS